MGGESGSIGTAGARGVAQVFAGLSADEAQVLGEADRFARAELYPLAAAMDEDESWPAHAFPLIGRNGYFGVTAPASLGGAGMDLFASGLVAQAFSRWNHALGLSWVAHENLCLNNILRNASDAQRECYLPGLCAGTAVGALGLTEPGAGSDALGSMRTTARRDGDHYVLNGTKLYITNGPVADVLLVYAKTDPERGAQGISAFIVERGFPGFRVAQKLRKMGFRGSPTAELVFDECRVPARNLVGEEGRGVKVLMSGLDLERAMVSPVCLGIAERALEITLDYARTRKQFGQPIASFQLVQQRLARMYVALSNVRRIVWADHIAGRKVRESIADVCAGKLYCGEMGSFVAFEAIHILAGNGYMEEYVVERLARDAKLIELGGGTTEIQILTIAREILA